VHRAVLRDDAQRLYLGQQALSKRIQRLEALLAMRLPDRIHQRVDVTPAGKRLRPHARRAGAPCMA
jgi:DNA-binding transcriptional LysR family regulator